MERFFFGGGFEVVFFLMFFLVSGIILLTFIKGIMQWNKNNHSPRLTVDATVVSRRMELQVNGSEYGMLVEGDRGRLSFQGTRYLGFERLFD